MEDTYCHKDKINQGSIFAIFDGHGGRHVADHCAHVLPTEFSKQLNQRQDISLTLQNVFQKLDSQLKLMDSDRCGSTACVAFLTQESNQKILYVANVGDTRAVLNKSGRGERLSKDHKTTDPQEIARIKAFGGSIYENRVAGGLAITRALGDHTYKKFGVSADPHIVRHIIRNQDKHLIIASDGVWDTVSDLQAATLCNDDSMDAH